VYFSRTTASPLSPADLRPQDHRHVQGVYAVVLRGGVFVQVQHGRVELQQRTKGQVKQKRHRAAPGTHSNNSGMLSATQ
jgi:hypothetical protein